MTYIHYDGKEERVLAIVENAYLAGESDIRQWAQSLGDQMFGRLQFDLKWDEDPPRIVYDIENDETVYFKHYAVKLYFRPESPDFEDRIKNFPRREYLHSEIVQEREGGTIYWKRKRHSDDGTKASTDKQ
ncbi:MAG: hypothetical protein KatS3mg105_2575 [Gemmatales bacterium]|nr:MAG: hypothetical protein KatS3mg105_2575 [Gemmatales bacterium]